MSYSYSQFKNKVSEIVKDDAGKLTILEQENFLQEAVKIYSRHRPCEVVNDFLGSGEYDYSIEAKLTSWVKGFSDIKSIEYPAGQREPNILDEEDWMIYETPSGQFIRFLEDRPSSNETIRVVYTTMHILSETENTISAIDEDAVCNLAASLCSQALASYYAQTSDSTIGADSVNYRTKSQEYEARARAQKKIYLDHIGIREGETTPSSVIGGEPLSSLRRGSLTH